MTNNNTLTTTETDLATFANADASDNATTAKVPVKPITKPPSDGIIKIQPLRKQDMQPTFAQELGAADVNYGFYGAMINCLGTIAGGLGQIPCCFCCPNPYKEVPQGSVGLITRFGQAIRSVDPGLAHINPCSESIKIANVQIQLSTLPRQQVLTRDSVNVEIDSVVYYHISNPYKAIFGVADVRQALIERAQTTLRHVVGSRNLQSVISDREAVAAEIQEIVESVSEQWGVTCESILIKDIILSHETQELLSSAATQRRIGESKIIGARAEVEAAKLMRQAADILASPAAMQIRQLEALQAMAKSSASKTIFVPMNLDSMGGASMTDATSAQITASGVGGRSSNANYNLRDIATMNQLAEQR
ncbi:hypothetical protein K437DRAFT_232405 [Tilletiaria anomala UBC 951]|uniref:Band 7 domain-containing protein n=1 Tax=Tilletiaria anomala (strain ATCC 24038 / CBS 436.72 / UBC 951) TaxID=1037660 RepID=A0A066WEW5_TILAU|nr:uncharacterized protein K437DRAFT_232405 [Tilletiaria anomala UBC 951]KDN52296.1 hypothetical protein K437DRAFT_232405 [Tilletiaria anomala UBC 951]